MTTRAWVLAVGGRRSDSASMARQAPADAGAAEGGRRPTRSRDTLYVLKGGGGNTALFLTANGAVLVDTKLPGWGQPLLDTVKSAHRQAGHDGDQHPRALRPHERPGGVPGRRCEVVAHENTKRTWRRPTRSTPCRAGRSRTSSRRTAAAACRAARSPTRSPSNSGADRIDLYYFGRAHTGGDTYVVFPALGVMHVGDTFPNRDLPIMDKNNGGSGVEFPSTLAKAAAVPGVTTIINGHIPTTMTPADVKTYSAFIGDFVAAVQAAKKAGKTVDDVVATWTTPAELRRLQHAAAGAGQGRTRK